MTFNDIGATDKMPEVILVSSVFCKKFNYVNNIIIYVNVILSK